MPEADPESREVVKPVFSPKFWADRIEDVRKQSLPGHYAVYHCHKSLFEEIEQLHREILADLIKRSDSILDVGCAYGRLLHLLPETWKGAYLGVDLSPDFIREAQKLYPARMFVEADLRNPPEGAIPQRYRWAILISVKRMVVANCGEEEWQNLLASIRKFADKVLILEYENPTESAEIL